MWHQQVGGTQVSGQYYLYGSCEGKQEGIAVRGKWEESQTIIFPWSCWQVRYEEHAPFTEEGHSCQQWRPRKGPSKQGPPCKEERERTRCDSWGDQTAPPVHRWSSKVIQTQQNLVVTLTLLTGFGILDVGYSFGAQRPDSNSQL